eukprot:TRINITY_DN9229_c0_g1_i1.p2 TRINITY_DN9229_c0_g1~~TRINITY_DN9229_c0_g1_i1.p2  ORF type:complete len:56 (-),score=1.18 TRINITY_DN9229_c0_g1_i1:344-511(-)
MYRRKSKKQRQFSAKVNIDRFEFRRRQNLVQGLSSLRSIYRPRSTQLGCLLAVRS